MGFTHKFIPIIHTDNEGRQIFITDEVDIEFPYKGKPRILNFNLADQLAPQIPFLYVGDAIFRSVFDVKEDIFVIDPLGNCWAQNAADNYRMYRVGNDLMMYSLRKGSHPDLDKITNLLQEIEIEYRS